MAKAPKSIQQEAATEQPDTAARDPQGVLRQPANPPRPNVVAFLLALVAFFAWFVYLVYVAWRG